MNAKKLARIRGDLAAARRNPQTQSDLITLAERLGRTRAKRGKEPTWTSHFPGLFPISIPPSKGGDLKPGTKKNILNQLEDDLLEWEMQLEQLDD